MSVGNDRNNGTSTSTPWLTINKVNTSTFNPGDSILFESTCTWREQLTVPSSGSVGSPITFGAYGTGANPTIDGSTVFSSWSPYTISGVYTATSASDVFQLFKNGVRLTQGSSPTTLNNQQWYWTGSVLYFCEDAGNPGSLGYTLNGSIRNFNVLLGQNYVTFQNLTMIYAAQQGLGLSAASDHLTISSCTVTQALKDGLAFSAYALTNSLIQNSDISWNGSAGIAISTGSVNNTIQYNNVHNNSQIATSAAGFQYSGGIYFWCPDGSIVGNIVQGNNIYSNGVLPGGSWVVPSGTGAWGMGLWWDTITTSSYISSNSSRFNNIYNNFDTGLNLEHTTYQQAYYNVVHDSAVAEGIRVGDMTHISQASYNLIYNNTVYNTTIGLHITGSSENNANDCMGNVIENNISVGSSLHNFVAEHGCENDGTMGSGNVYLYNGFGAAAANFIGWGTGIFYATYAAWETAMGNCGLAGCSHSVQAAPQFVNASAGQFGLTSGSPGIGAGVNLGSPYNIGLLPGSTWPTGVTTGPTNTPPDIGAFIYVPAVAPPSSLVLSVH